MANDTKIKFDMELAKWLPNQYLFANALNNQVNENRNLLHGIFNALSDLYANANNDGEKTIGNHADVDYIKTLVQNSLKGILDTTKAATPIDIMLNSGKDILLKGTDIKFDAKGKLTFTDSSQTSNTFRVVNDFTNFHLDAGSATNHSNFYLNGYNMELNSLSAVRLAYQPQDSGSGHDLAYVKTDSIGIELLDSRYTSADVLTKLSWLEIRALTGTTNNYALDFFGGTDYSNGVAGTQCALQLNHQDFKVSGKYLSNSFSVKADYRSFEINGSLDNWKFKITPTDITYKGITTGGVELDVIDTLNKKVPIDYSYANGKGTISNSGAQISLINADTNNSNRYRLDVKDSGIFIQQGNNQPISLFGMNTTLGTKQQQLYEHCIQMIFDADGAGAPEITVYFTVNTVDSYSYSGHEERLFRMLGQYSSQKHNVSGLDVDSNQSYICQAVYVTGFSTWEDQNDGTRYYEVHLCYNKIEVSTSVYIATNIYPQTVTGTTIFTKSSPLIDRRFRQARPPQLWDDVRPLIGMAGD